jgi:hypothetical protein
MIARYKEPKPIMPFNWKTIVFLVVVAVSVWTWTYYGFGG